MIVCTHVESGCSYPEGDCLGFCDNSWQWSRCPHAVKADNTKTEERLHIIYEDTVTQWLKQYHQKKEQKNVA